MTENTTKAARLKEDDIDDQSEKDAEGKDGNESCSDASSSVISSSVDDGLSPARKIEDLQDRQHFVRPVRPEFNLKNILPK